MDTSKFAGIPVLLNRLSLVEAISVAWKIETAAFRGEPWNDLAPPEDEKERLSREQIAPAILLYRELLKTHPQPEAYDIVAATAIAGGVKFLKKSIGILDQAMISQKSEEELRAWSAETGQKFFNADIKFDVVSSEAVGFTVSRCRFPELCIEVGVPELAPAFCATDEAFFGKVQPNVTLTRPNTIAGGSDHCAFHLAWDK